VRLEVARTSQVGEWASQSRKETFSHPVDLRKGGTDGRNPLRRFREVPWAVGSHGGARRLRIAIHDILIGSEPSIVWDTCQEILRSRGSENRSFRAQRNLVIRNRDPRFPDKI
jgi:hypothetical protein